MGELVVRSPSPISPRHPLGQAGGGGILTEACDWAIGSRGERNGEITRVGGVMPVGMER
jgi:hypothetical protein